MVYSMQQEEKPVTSFRDASRLERHPLNCGFGRGGSHIPWATQCDGISRENSKRDSHCLAECMTVGRHICRQISNTHDMGLGTETHMLEAIFFAR